VNRILFRDLAEERARDALGLINIGQWSGAYYLAGYAVECGLKACIARKTSQDDFPDKEFAIKCFTHRFDPLVILAGLESAFKAKVLVDRTFDDYWQIVVRWDETARYKIWSESDARDLYEATTNPTSGALSWIKAHW
jgi:hypothetical protein